MRTFFSNRACVEDQRTFEIEADMKNHSATATKVIPRHAIDVALVQENIVSASIDCDEAVRDLYLGNSADKPNRGQTSPRPTLHISVTGMAVTVRTPERRV